MINATFLMELHIGHRVYYENLRRFIDSTPKLSAEWVEITYHDRKSFWHRLPFLPAGARGTCVGWSQTRQGLKKSADVFFFNTQVPAALAGNLVKRRPYVLATDITPVQYDRMAELYEHQVDRFEWLRRYKHKANTRLFQDAAKVLPWSTWTASSLLNDYDVKPEQIEIIPPGIDTQLWRPSAHCKEGPKRILFVGGDFYRKGGEILLNAYRRLPHGIAELALVTRSQVPAGEGIQVYNHLQPNSPELIALFQTSDLFVLPTQAEAFGIAAVEASAAGLPVIATRVGGLPDIVLDGITGFLIPAGDVSALADRLHLLLDWHGLRRQFGRAARERVLRCFNARINARRVAQILSEIGEK